MTNDSRRQRRLGRVALKDMDLDRALAVVRRAGVHVTGILTILGEANDEDLVDLLSKLPSDHPGTIAMEGVIRKCRKLM